MLFPGPGSSCATAQVDVPIGPNNAGKIQWKLNASSPGGNTPMATALNAAKNYLGGMKIPKKRYVLLVTDGAPNCSPSDPLPSVKALFGMGIKTFVVGFGLGVDAGKLTAMASSGGTSKYYKANNATDLQKVLATIGGLMSCCGNGKKESWEKCEKSLPAGAPGACLKDPKKCPYKKCMAPYLKGSACDVECAWKAVTAAKSGDGCCPPGANFNTDKDCPANCGNGVLEANEKCDPGIKSGVGKCKTAADCKDTDVCTTETVIGPACHRACQTTTIKPNTEGKDGCCPKGLSMMSDADCPPPCGPDKTKNCVNTCTGVKCPNGFYCQYGKCLPKKGPNPTGDGGTSSGGDGAGSGTGNGNNGEGFIDGEGCACSVDGSGRAGLGLLLLLGVLAVLGRRRR